MSSNSKSELLLAGREFGVAIWGFVRRSIWPLQIGVLGVIIGFMSSTIPTIGAIPALREIDEASKDYEVRNNLYWFMQFLTTCLNITLFGFGINAARSIVYNSQAYRKRSILEVSLNVFLELFNLFIPMFLIYIGLKFLRDTNILLGKETGRSITNVPVGSALKQNPFYSAVEHIGSHPLAYALVGIAIIITVQGYATWALRSRS